MERTSSPDDPSAYLENLMHAGQQSMKRFDDALATAMGVPNKSSAPMGPVFSPLAFAIDMQREYVTQFWRFWNGAAIGRQRSPASRRLRGSSAPPASHRR